MAFIALSFVVPFFSYYVLCNLSYDVTRWTWYCNKAENHAYRRFSQYYEKEQTMFSQYYEKEQTMFRHKY